MAQELREGDGKSGIARAGKRKWGYDPAQVDAFLERAHALYDSEGMNLTQHDIQNVSFDLRKNGYVIAQVDAALGRLERAVVDKQTTWEIAQHGRVTWKAKTEKLYHEVQNHAERNERERFKSGAPKQPSYDKKQVDRLVDQIVDKAAAALGVDGVTEDDVRSLADLNANTVNNVIFTQRKGKKGYDERQVDYFLNACVQLLSRLESYARVADFVSGEPAAPAQTATNVTVQANGVSPLFASGTQRPATDERFAPAAVAHDESFDALHQAEQSLFTAPAPVAPAAPAAAAPIAYASAPASFDASTSTNSTNAEQPVSFAPAPRVAVCVPAAITGIESDAVVEAVMAAGVTRVLAISQFQWIGGMMETACGSIRGLGKTINPTVTTLIGACGLRVIWLYTIFKAVGTIESLYWSYPVSWTLTLVIHIVFLLIYKRQLEALQKGENACAPPV